MKIAVLAEQNFNLIDGSTIWLLNVCKLLALQPDFNVTLLLSHPLTDRVLADEVPDTIHMVDPAEMAALTGAGPDRLTPETLLASLSDWEASQGSFDRIFVRGTAYIEELLSSRTFAPKLVGYAPSAIPDLGESEPIWVQQGRAGRMPLVVQSDTAKTALESLSDYPAHVVHVVPPIVFQTPQGTDTRAADMAVLCYSGKIDLHYGMDWLLDICRRVGDTPALRVSLIAGKDTYRPRFRDFFKQMDRFRADLAAGNVKSVELVTNVPHAQAKARMGQADFAYCLRHDRYDDVIEISTKIVEFCTLGVAPILNDNALNRALFGEDYPYYVDIAKEDIPARVLDILGGKNTKSHARAQAAIARVAAGFAAEALSDRLATAIRGRPAALVLTERPRHLMIATHEPKFLHQFCDYLRGNAQVTMRWQYWASTTKPKSKLTIPDSVDTVLCEWCCENAVWHSVNKRTGTRLIIRLHRFEAFRDFPERVNWEAVDALIVVSDHFRELMIERFGVNPAIIHVLPQYIDWDALQRPKLAQAQFTCGLVGINPFDHKRFDRAIDFFAALHRVDPRFTLSVRSVMPWEIDWVWNNREEDRIRFEAVFERIFSNPELTSAVRFDLPGSDMEEWYRSVGTIVSSSDTEGCHTSALEGMAAGCYPVVYNWPGARSLFAPFVHNDMTNAIADIRAFADQDIQTLMQARIDMAQRVKQHDVKQFTQTFFTL